MGEAAYAGGIEFTGDNKCGGIGTEVEEQLEMGNQQNTRMVEETAAYLGNGEADEFPSRSQMRIITSNDGKHEGADEEALNLDPATTQYLNEVDGQEVPRHVASRGDDEISIRVLEEGVIFRFAFGETDGG